MNPSSPNLLMLDHYASIVWLDVDTAIQHDISALFTPLPHDLYNTHPRNPKAAFAPLVHCFGPYNIWNDGRMMCAFPEWTRDYRRWLALGGSPHSGEIRYANFCPKGPMELLGLASSAKEA